MPDMVTARSLYEQLSTTRNNFLRRAEKAAALTIPMLVPRNGEIRVGSIKDFPTPRQGVGARGVNHLASRILLTLLPPQAPFFKFDLDAFGRSALSQGSPEIAAEVEATLRRMEDAIHRAVNIEAIRVPSSEICKHLIVAGNVCQYFPAKGGMAYYPLSQYVVVRDAEGDEIIDFVLKEYIDKRALPEDVKKLVEEKQSTATTGGRIDSATSTSDDYVELYTRQYRVNEKLYKKYQEVCGVIIPGTEGTFKPSEVPYRPLRWTKVQGEAYGRGMIEEYLGDLVALEGLSQALVEGALAAARVVGLVLPNSQTRAQDLNDAKNGEFVLGRKEDISFLQLEKFADFRTASEVAARIEKRLEQSFLLNSSIIRDAERVTAEEVRFAAQELETTLGGVYTVLAHEFQLPLVNSILARLQKKGEIPEFPEGVRESIKPVIVTGVDALGRNAELDRLRAAVAVLAGIIGPEATAQTLKHGPLTTYIFTNAGVKAEGLIKTDQEMQAEQKQAQRMAMMQEAVSKGVGPGIGAVSAATLAQNEQGEA